MIIDEEVEFLPVARNSPLPAGERATLHLELTPFLSRNNRPSLIAERIPCISILKRIHRAGAAIPPGHDLRECEGVKEVDVAISNRILHELKVGGELVVQASVSNKRLRKAVTRSLRDGHNVVISYTEAGRYTEVPRLAALPFMRSLANIHVRVARWMATAAATRLYVTREVRYSRFKYYGDTALVMAHGARRLDREASWPYLRPWVALFDDAVSGRLDVDDPGLAARQFEALRESVHLVDDPDLYPGAPEASAHALVNPFVAPAPGSSMSVLGRASGNDATLPAHNCSECGI